ncbi:MAG: tetratricopeptide repeat protein [Thermosynechococcaceae cyanobacterium MS004]|nr:tetratricopeptide repeat protein [Thermosynechococcaceae cyanobacterium MS004]
MMPSLHEQKTDQAPALEAPIFHFGQETITKNQTTTCRLIFASLLLAQLLLQALSGEALAIPQVNSISPDLDHKSQKNHVALNTKSWAVGSQTPTNSEQHSLKPVKTTALGLAVDGSDRVATVSAATLNNRGIERMNQGDYSAAKTLFNQALQVNPRFAPAYNNRAMLHILTGEEKEAVQDYSRSIALNPKDADVYVNRGLAYAALENTAAAIADYTRALQLNPKNAQAYHARGTVYLSLNNRAMARADFQQAAALYLQQGNQEDHNGLQEFLKQF